jgi:glycosyltransferase involved in cell wall biosynthesis
MKKDTFEILVATTNDKFLHRLGGVECRAVVINQSNTDDCRNVGMHSVHSYNERGLSASRNRALAHARADICLITDDDVGFNDGIEQHIVRVFEQYPEADIVTFQAYTPEGEPFKSNYRDSPFWHNRKSIMRVCSIEIAFRRSSVIGAEVMFDEQFGLGAKFATGEEIIFLNDCLNAGLRVLYYPLPIVTHPKESSGGQLAGNPALIQAKGAMFYRIFGLSGLAVSVLFALRKHAESGFGLFRFISFMLLGSISFRSVKQGKAR